MQRSKLATGASPVSVTDASFSPVTVASLGGVVGNTVSCEKDAGIEQLIALYTNAVQAAAPLHVRRYPRLFCLLHKTTEDNANASANVPGEEANTDTSGDRHCISRRSPESSCSRHATLTYDGFRGERTGIRRAGDATRNEQMDVLRRPGSAPPKINISRRRTNIQSSINTLDAVMNQKISVDKCLGRPVAHSERLTERDRKGEVWRQKVKSRWSDFRDFSMPSREQSEGGLSLRMELPGDGTQARVPGCCVIIHKREQRGGFVKAREQQARSRIACSTENHGGQNRPVCCSEVLSDAPEQHETRGGRATWDFQGGLSCGGKFTVLECLESLSRIQARSKHKRISLAHTNALHSSTASTNKQRHVDNASKLQESRSGWESEFRFLFGTSLCLVKFYTMRPVFMCFFLCVPSNSTSKSAF